MPHLHTGLGEYDHTVSAFIVKVDSTGEPKLLLHHHKKLDVLLQPGGHIELTETPWAAIAHEIKEETGLEVTNIQYQSSQPWPYPSNLMAGFMAEYKSGDISLQESVLSAGAWFKYNELPLIPDKASLARKLIDNWLKQFKQQL